MRRMSCQLHPFGCVRSRLTGKEREAPTPPAAVFPKQRTKKGVSQNRGSQRSTEAEIKRDEESFTRRMPNMAARFSPVEVSRAGFIKRLPVPKALTRIQVETRAGKRPVAVG